MLRISKQQDISIYPNPNNGSFEIVLDNPIKDMLLSIYDITGNLVKLIPIYQGQKNYIVDLEVSNGIYFLKTQTSGYQKIERMVVRK